MKLSDFGFEASDLFPKRQVFLLSFFITLVESIHLSGDFVKAFTHFISEGPNLSPQLLSQKQPQRFYFVVGDWHCTDVYHTARPSYNRIKLIKRLQERASSFESAEDTNPIMKFDK